MSAPTTQDWRTLPAGRELDALVAERVMGWERTLLPSGPSMIPDEAAWRTPDGRTFYADSWRPSEDIAAAWQVVEEMERRGFHAKLTTPFMPNDDHAGFGMYHAGFTPHGVSGWNGSPDYRGHADAMPLAICRAALAAVDADRSEVAHA